MYVNINKKNTRNLVIMKCNSILFILIVCAYNTRFIYASEHCLSSSEYSKNQCSKQTHLDKDKKSFTYIKDKKSFTSKLWNQFTKRFDSYSDHIHSVTSVTGQNSATTVASGTGKIVGAGVGIVRSGNDLVKFIGNRIYDVGEYMDDYISEDINTIHKGISKKCKNIFIRNYFKGSIFSSTSKIDNDKWLGKINGKGICSESVEITSNNIDFTNIDSLDKYKVKINIEFSIYLKHTIEKRCETINTKDHDHPCYHIKNTISWFHNM